MAATFNRQRLLKGSASSVTAMVVRVLVQLIQVPILYSAWDVKQASAWLVLWTLPSYMSLTVASFSTAGGNFAVEAKREGDIAGVCAAYRATQLSVVASNLLMVMVVGALFNVIVDDSQWGISHSRVIWTILGLGAYVVIRVQSATQDMIFRYGEDYGGYSLYESGASLIELAAIAVVVNLTHNMVVLPVVLASVRLAFYIAMHTQVMRRWPEVLGKADPVLVKAMLRRLFVPFLGFVTMPLLFSINIQGYSLLVSNHFGPVVFATFLTMRTLARLIDQLCGIVNRMLFFELSYLDYERDRVTVIGVTAMTMMMLVGMGALYTSALLLFGQPLHHIWTAGKIAFSAQIVLVFGVAALMRATSDSLFSMLASRNAHVVMAMLYLLGSVTALGVALVLARHGAGVVWVAACVNIAEFVSVIAGIAASARLFGMSFPGFVMALAVQGPRALSRLPQMIRQRGH